MHRVPAAYTVKRIDEVVRQPHLVTHDQPGVGKSFRYTWRKFYYKYRTFFADIYKSRTSFKSSSSRLRLEPRFSGLLSDTVPLRHNSLYLIIKDLAKNFIIKKDSWLRHGPAVWKCKPIPNRRFKLPYSSLFFQTYLYFVPTTISSSRYVLALEVKKSNWGKLRKSIALRWIYTSDFKIYTVCKDSYTLPLSAGWDDWPINILRSGGGGGCASLTVELVRHFFTVFSLLKR